MKKELDIPDIKLYDIQYIPKFFKIKKIYFLRLKRYVIKYSIL